MFPHEWTIAGLAIAIIAIAAICAAVGVALKYFEFKPPWWAEKIFWIIVVALVCIGAVKLIVAFWHWSP